ncbi:hypothetical protein ElyMa_003849100 [Elysia marginata]|uniref:Uncharacterized protein n=1 Tax=Elysia marginata TaxID=1093978 RepID=A0AAV4FHM3_9GAST|nr:hypothetical protein ElyMa_003849100 [Elysia marginata]
MAMSSWSPHRFSVIELKPISSILDHCLFTRDAATPPPPPPLPQTHTSFPWQAVSSSLTSVAVHRFRCYCFLLIERQILPMEEADEFSSVVFTWVICRNGARPGAGCY